MAKQKGANVNRKYLGEDKSGKTNKTKRFPFSLFS
jgi:hypothetical protein